MSNGQANRCTVDTARDGFVFSGSGGVIWCIAANCWEYGFDGVGSYAADYCIAPGGHGFSWVARGWGA